MTESQQIDVSVTTQYMQDHSDPLNNHYAFSYTVVIKNAGNSPAKLLSRHWIITDADGNIQEVRGVGVIGEQPHLKPGESFRYTSSTVLATPVGSMQGSYHMVTDDGIYFTADIPVFSLAIPNILN